ncbi:hypothetical protein RirG_107550 [Rhizophagus irregularis DAOM 197198w]|uniref:Uncharacterized protein n=1 Tax=Rhizophagus irregularis (strain DAOM 197198w) TaxID=1432141 RepID=A0A015JLW1_RHIIW|nr:hypothetical protein RirG_107550 [Rhizophagus irregularis DAOM 197198w]
MHDQNEFSSFLKRVEAKGLVYIDASDEKPMVIMSLGDISIKNYYRISTHLTYIRKGITWLQIEDQAMEKKTLLAIEKALHENIWTPFLKIFNKQILLDSKKNTNN